MLLGFSLILGLSNWLNKGLGFWWELGSMGGFFAAMIFGILFFLSYNRHFLNG